MFYKIFDEYGTETESEIIFVSPNIVYAIGTNSCYEEEDNFWLCYTINETVDFNSINNILLGKFNKNDYSFQSWILGDTGVSEYYKTIFKNQDGNLVLVGTSTWYYGGDSIVNNLGVKILDTIGNIIEERYYEYDDWISTVGFYGEQLTNGDYILSGWVSELSTPDDLDMYYLRTDSEGTKLWEKRIGHPTENDGACHLYSYNADTLLLTGNYFHNFYIAYLDTNGEILQEKYGGEFDFGDVSVTQSNPISTDIGFKILLLEKDEITHLPMANYLELDKEFNIIKLNDISGSIGEDNYFNDIKYVEDCGFITCGYVVYEDNTAQARIIKLSSDGDTCIPPDCEGYEEPEECMDTAVEYLNTTSELYVFPNPAYYQFSIGWKDDSTQFHFTYLEIINLQGGIVARSEFTRDAVVDVSSLQAGLYLLKIYNQAGLLQYAKLSVQ